MACAALHCTVRRPLTIYDAYRAHNLLPAGTQVLDATKLVKIIDDVIRSSDGAYEGMRVAVSSILFDPFMFYFITTWVATWVAVVGFHPQLFAVHLLGIFVKYRGLQTVLKAVVRPRKLLALTALLFVVLEYLFALTGYMLFQVPTDCSFGGCMRHLVAAGRLPQWRVQYTAAMHEVYI